MNIFDFNRIVVLGNNGSGKSFISKELSIITGLPLIHLDVEFWRPNWEMPSNEEWRRKNMELTSKEKWIIDGNVSQGGTMAMRFKTADLVIFLDINRFVCLAGVLKRYGKRRSDFPQYLEERLDKEFIRFLKGLWNFSRTRRRSIMSLHNTYPDKPFFIIDSRRKMKKLLRRWRDEKLSGSV